MNRAYQILFLGFLTLCDSSTAKSETVSSSVAIYINFHDPSALHENPDGSFVRFRKSFADQNRRFIFIRATGRSDLMLKIKNIEFKEGETISHLLISAHGGSATISSTRSNQHGETISRTLYAGSILNGERLKEEGDNDLVFYLPLNSLTSPEEMVEAIEDSNSETMETFGPLRERMGKDAAVFCTACKILQGDRDLSLAKAFAISHILGLRDGFFYGNVSNGTMRFFPGVFWQAPNLKSKMVYGLLQVSVSAVALGTVFIDPLEAISLPVMGGIIAISKAMRNKGYEVSMESGSIKQIRRTRSEFFSKLFFGHTKLGCEGTFLENLVSFIRR